MITRQKTNEKSASTRHKKIISKNHSIGSYVRISWRFPHFALARICIFILVLRFVSPNIAQKKIKLKRNERGMCNTKIYLFSYKIIHKFILRLHCRQCVRRICAPPMSRGWINLLRRMQHLNMRAHSHDMIKQCEWPHTPRLHWQLA